MSWKIFLRKLYPTRVRVKYVSMLSLYRYIPLCLIEKDRCKMYHFVLIICINIFYIHCIRVRRYRIGLNWTKAVDKTKRKMYRNVEILGILNMIQVSYTCQISINKNRNKHKNLHKCVEGKIFLIFSREAKKKNWKSA